MKLPSSLAVGAVLASSLLTSACISQDLSFRVDTRLHITSPADRSEVTLPVHLGWTIRDFELKSSPSDASGGSFAIFIDRSPVPPGKPLSWLARNDSTCASTPGCPDAAFYAQLGVYQTTDTQLVIRSLPADVTSSSSSKRDRHHATIILLDPAGKRVGEIAYDVTFDLKKKG